jgi:hypothetical protein
MGTLMSGTYKVNQMDWFEVVSERGSIEDGKVAEFQVIVKVGFKIAR